MTPRDRFEDTRFIGATESPEQAAARRKARGDALRFQLLAAAGIPTRFEHAQLDSLTSLPLDVRQPYADAVKLLRQTLRGPVIVGLCGPRGPGKTYIACGIVAEWCTRLTQARYAVTADFFRAIRSHYGQKGGSEEATVAGYALPALLVLDEVQERAETEWEQRTLTNLLDRRYAEMRTTLLITNQTKSEFLRSIGESVASRIRDGGGVIECLWPSLRGRFPADR